MGASRLDLRDVGGCARWHDGCTGAARRPRGIPPRALAAGCVPSARRVAVSRRAPRLRAADDGGRPNRVSGGARRRLANAEVELLVYATDVSEYPHGDETR